MEGVFAVQDEIARSIADALTIKLAVRPSVQEQPGNGAYDPYLPRLFTDVTNPRGINSIDISVPLQNPFSPATVSDHTSPKGFEPRLADTRVSAAPPETGFTTARTPRHIDNSITAAPQAAGSTTGMRHRPLEPSVPMNKITADGRASIQGFVKDAKGEPIK